MVVMRQVPGWPGRRGAGTALPCPQGTSPWGTCHLRSRVQFVVSPNPGEADGGAAVQCRGPSAQRVREGSAGWAKLRKVGSAGAAPAAPLARWTLLPSVTTASRSGFKIPATRFTFFLQALEELPVPIVNSSSFSLKLFAFVVLRVFAVWFHMVINAVLNWLIRDGVLMIFDLLKRGREGVVFLGKRCVEAAWEMRFCRQQHHLALLNPQWDHAIYLGAVSSTLPNRHLGTSYVFAKNECSRYFYIYCLILNVHR